MILLARGSDQYDPRQHDASSMATRKTVERYPKPLPKLQMGAWGYLLKVMSSQSRKQRGSRRRLPHVRHRVNAHGLQTPSSSMGRLHSQSTRLDQLHPQKKNQECQTELGRPQRIQETRGGIPETRYSVDQRAWDTTLTLDVCAHKCGKFTILSRYEVLNIYKGKGSQMS